jgi:hypothetical protein
MKKKGKTTNIANNRGYKVGKKRCARTTNEYYQDTFGDNPGS